MQRHRSREGGRHRGTRDGAISSGSQSQPALALGVKLEVIIPGLAVRSGSGGREWQDGDGRWLERRSSLCMWRSCSPMRTGHKRGAKAQSRCASGEGDITFPLASLNRSLFSRLRYPRALPGAPSTGNITCLSLLYAATTSFCGLPLSSSSSSPGVPSSTGWDSGSLPHPSRF